MVVYKLTLPLTLANIVGIGYFPHQFILILPKSFQLSYPDFSKEKKCFLFLLNFILDLNFFFQLLR